jgi:hypothetical protein
MKTTKPLMPGANPEAMKADLERRRSNAARPIPARKARRQGSRSSAKKAAIRGGW